MLTALPNRILLLLRKLKNEERCLYLYTFEAEPVFAVSQRHKCLHRPDEDSIMEWRPVLIQSIFNTILSGGIASMVPL